MPAISAEIRSVFDQAAEIAAPSDRRAFLDEACAASPGMREKVEALLAAHAAAGSFLETPPLVLASQHTLDVPPREPPGTQIGPYKLLQQVGEGGMGVVYMAEQAEPVERRVALKIIKPGMDTRQVIARFEAERQALAVMDHPNIARVLDAGMTGSGRSYFVMELVNGDPITKFCDERRLSLRERLELFVPVCQAIQHAHQKGIIHRDIKPTNVLVALYDGQPVPKVIDFGVAKATALKLSERTMFTEFGQLVGTLEYMSPEQAQLNQLDIDTRSDIYSLGVLLYEMLTGTTPLDERTLRSAAFDEMLRIIREREPPKPSTRLDSGDTLPSVAANRRVEPARLGRAIRGELDWIVMKALDKDRNRRYETASGLALDVQRYLAGEPVLAHPPSKLYKMRKLAWRHKGACLAASLVGLLLLVTVATLAFSNARIRQEQALTQKEKVRAERAQARAERHASNERQELEKLKQANVWLERGRWFSGRHRWDDAHIAFTKAVELRPDHAAAWVERGELSAILGLWDQAAADFEQEFKLGEPAATPRWYRLALLRLHQGDLDGYRRMCERMRQRFRGTRDMDFATEALRASVLAADPELDLGPLLEQALHAQRVRPNAWYDQYMLGITEYRAGRYAQAAEHLQGALNGDPHWEVRALSYSPLAMALHRLGRTVEARAALQSAAEAGDRWTKERYDHTEGMHWIAHFGATAKWPVAWWDWLEWQVYYCEAKQLIDGAAPPDDPRLIVLRARALAGMRKNFAADAEYAAALRLLPDDTQVRAEAHRNAAYSAIGRQQWRQAHSEFSRACTLLPSDFALSGCEAVAALAAEDVPAYRRTCARMVSQCGAEPVRETANQVVWVCVLEAEAVEDFGRLLELARIAMHSHQSGSGVLMGALYRAGNLEEAIACLETARRMYSLTAWEWAFAAMAHHRLGRTDEARRCLAKARAWTQAADRQTEVDLRGVLPTWGSWRTPIACRRLLHEAEQMVDNNSDPGL